MTRRSWMMAIAMVMLAAGVLVRGEQAGPQGEPQVFRSRVEVVEVDAAVTRGGAAVAGLTTSNFVVTDNGVVQNVTAALLGSEPLRVTMVLDVSRSVSGSKLASLIKAGSALVSALGPKDQASLISFSHQVSLRVPMSGNFAEMLSVLAGLTGTGATSLRDAIYLGLATASDDQSRALLLAFSDGVDTASFMTGDAVIESARRSNAVVHAVHFVPDRFLSRLTETTGGRTWSARSDRQLEELFGRVLDEMRARYRLTYTPAGPQKPGWHQIKVSLKGARGDVIAKQGYFVQ